MKKIIFFNVFLTILFAKDINTYLVDADNSQLRWTATKLTGSHWGYVKIKKGEIVLNQKQIISGKIFVDLNSITVEDMGDSPWAEKLVNHLKSEDFFDVKNFSLASLDLKSSNLKDGSFLINGDLAIKGKTHQINFPAVINFSDSGPIASGQLKIDRTNYNIKYRSGKFYPDIGDKLIYDDFIIDFILKTR